MLFFKLYASRYVTLHAATGKAVEENTANVNKYKRKGQREREREREKLRERKRVKEKIKNWCSLCHHKRMELFSYRTRSGWLPRLSLPPCSWRCKCNLLHPLSWHLLLPIQNHPHSGCTYHPIQGQCRYCSRQEKEKKNGKRHSWVHIKSTCLLEGPANMFLSPLTMICLEFYLRGTLVYNK